MVCVICEPAWTVRVISEYNKEPGLRSWSSTRRGQPLQNIWGVVWPLLLGSAGTFHDRTSMGMCFPGHWCPAWGCSYECPVAGLNKLIQMLHHQVEVRLLAHPTEWNRCLQASAKWFDFLRDRHTWSPAGQLEGELRARLQFLLIRAPTEDW